MREGDTRSTIRVDKAVLGNYVDVIAWQLAGFIDLVMEVTTEGDTFLAKLDIGDQHSRVLPWAGQPTPRNAGEWNRMFQSIEDEAEKVVLEAHQILLDLIPNLDPEPVIEHDWEPLPQPDANSVVIHAY